MGQINKVIRFEDDTNIKYIPPNNSYKMLGEQTNRMLESIDHLKHVTRDIRKLAKVMAKRTISSTYNATHLL